MTVLRVGSQQFFGSGKGGKFFFSMEVEDKRDNRQMSFRKKMFVWPNLFLFDEFKVVLYSNFLLKRY
jgi:hypothetical protein